ncbi:hypothetical protein [Halopseudomonas sp.]|uniref:hypothetical protein n=1 Tax=Halopseudomonas sp. TaxID=2901191 RepID=UPI0030015508
MKVMVARRARLLPVVVLAVLALFVLMTAGLRLLTERMADNRLFAVLINDQQLTLDGATLREFNDDLLRLTEQQRSQAELQMRQWTDGWLDRSFTLATDAVPQYLDWYYSMPGSYSRLYHAIGGNLDSFVAERMGYFLFETSGFQQQLATFDAQMLDRWQALAKTQQRVIGKQLTGLYEDRQTEEGVAVASTLPVLNIDQALASGLRVSAEDMQRWRIGSQASVVAGAGTLALLARRTLLPRLMSLGAVQGARRALAGFVARLAPRLAVAITAGGTAATVTAPSGPGALVAGSVAFLTAAGTLVVTDFTLLKAEEALLRERKENEIRAELLISREALRVRLHQELEATTMQAAQEINRALAMPYERPEMDRRFHILGQ